MYLRNERKQHFLYYRLYVSLSHSSISIIVLCLDHLLYPFALKPVSRGTCITVALHSCKISVLK